MNGYILDIYTRKFAMLPKKVKTKGYKMKWVWLKFYTVKKYAEQEI